jgi:hypothetical protein
MEDENVSDDRSTTGHVDSIMQPFVEFWMGYFKQADEATREYLEGLDGGAEIRSWQRQWFDAVSKSMDAYMRSPAFLQVVKHGTEFAIKTKRHNDDVSAEIARNVNVPTASDISGLFERMRCRCEENQGHRRAVGTGELVDRLRNIEETVLNRLDAIEQRLTAIESKLSTSQQVSS